MAAIAAFLESCKKNDEASTPMTPTAPTVNFDLDLSASSNAALNNVGGFIYNGGVVVACIAANSYVALSKTCTHQGCTVAFGGGTFNCPCHGGQYNTNGNVIAGPPPSPLKKYTCTLNGNILNVAG